jgi:DNA-directed RNA polymerase specialized sigma24 family protein
MDEPALANRFDRERPRLRAVAYRILGSLSDADDAVQETWLRLQRTGAGEIDNLEAWLNIVRARSTRGEQPLDGFVPEPLVSPATGEDPEYEALLSDAVGVALQVVLDTLAPAERVAFVLHDMFAVPFDEIATLLDRSPQAARQLASRARRRVQDTAPTPDMDMRTQRTIVDAFFAAARDGDLDALVAVLDPDVVARNHGRRRVTELRGADQVARGALQYRRFAPFVRPALINGAAGVVAFDGEQPFALLAFTVRDGRAVAIDIFNDRQLVPKLVRHAH